MLFQRLYNWIKYKTLPPSFLFKNRLFLERDSKHRRIFSNFGLNFRSSKWSSYDTYNIKIKSRTAFVKYISILLSLFLFLFTFCFYQNYYINIYIFNNLAFAFWIIIDSFDYYLSFIIWLSVSLLSSLFNFLYSYFFFNNFSKKSTFLFNKNEILRSNALDLNAKKLSTSKSDLNWLVYSWLTNGTSPQKSKVLESIFETSVNKNWWSDTYSFFPRLYNTVFTLNKLDHSVNFFSLNNKINQQLLNHNYFGLNFLSLINNTSFTFKNSDILLYFYLKSNQFETSFRSSNNINNDFKLWGISPNAANNYEYSFLTKDREGLFFLDSFNYNKLNNLFVEFNEFWAINFYIKNQLDASKWNRWLYRYSILHRKILKNSHKLTLTKKLINSGFYDNNVFAKNTWSSETFSKLSKDNPIFSLLTSPYQPLLNNNLSNSFVKKSTFISNSDAQQKKLLNLSFYENSYFWFLKRFYFFNTLPTNTIKSKMSINIKGHKSFDNNSSSNQYSLAASYLLKSNLHLSSLFEKKNLITGSGTSNQIDKKFLSFFSKDVYPLLSETDILSKDNLTLLFWITSVSSTDTSSNYLKLLQRNQISAHQTPQPVFNKQSFRASEILKFCIFSSSFDSNQLFIKDLNYLTLFN